MAEQAGGERVGAVEQIIQARGAVDRGRDVLVKNPRRVDLKVLSAFSEFAEFRQAQGGTSDLPKLGTEVTAQTAQDQTPEERIDSAYRELRAALAADVLERVSEQTPEFFEQLVLDVLTAIGYGGTSAVPRNGSERPATAESMA